LDNTTAKLPLIRYPLPDSQNRSFWVLGPCLVAAIVSAVGVCRVSRTFYTKMFKQVIACKPMLHATS